MLTRIAVLVSGGGTNLQALLDAQGAGKLLHGQIVLVVSDVPGAYALQRAERAGVPALTLPRRQLGNEEFERQLSGLLAPGRGLKQPAVELDPYVEEEVDFDTFLKSDFRAVKIKNCEAVKKSDKLLKFTLDDGSGTDRIILSGIHQYYEPEQLIGKTAIAILNLPPRKMMGIPSCGMLISAVHQEHGEEKLHLMLIDDSVPAGAKLC